MRKEKRRWSKPRPYCSASKSAKHKTKLVKYLSRLPTAAAQILKKICIQTQG